MSHPHEKTRTLSTPGIKIDSTLVDQDLLIHEAVTMFGSNPRLVPLMAELAEKSKPLSNAGSRVGSLTAKILPDGELEIRFVSRYPIVRGIGARSGK
jgi:hypothetical protein